MRVIFLVCIVTTLGTVFTGCLKTTSYKPLPAPAGEGWGIERDQLSKSTMAGTSYQEKSSYDNKVYNVYLTKMIQELGDSYGAQNTYDAIKNLCPEPGKAKCSAKSLPYRSLKELPGK